MYGQLEEQELPWAKTAIFQADERIAPAGSDERNLTHLIAALSIGAQGSLRPMPVNDDDPEAAARALRASRSPRRSSWSTSASAPTATPPRWSRATRCSR